MAAARKLADFHGGTSYALCVQLCSRIPAGDDADAFGIAVALRMALHGRALAVGALPGLPFPDEEPFVDLLAERLVG